MIITISGKAGSGKSTIAKLLSSKLGLRHYSIGDVMRQMAKDRGISLLELNRIAEKDRSIDTELDERLKTLGKKEDDFVIDGRLTAFFIPHATFRIFLQADSRVRAERILKAERADERTRTLTEMQQRTEEREESERVRYREYYDVDYTDRKLYTHVIDTSRLDVKSVVRRILDAIGKKS